MIATLLSYILLLTVAPSMIPIREFSGYLSPLYSPTEFALWVPIGFRLSCYYYRKFYYRKIFSHPFSCARPEKAGRKYIGETSFPFIASNIHRYFLYGSIVIWGFLFYDTVVGMFLGGVFNFRVGSVLLWVNVILLGLYTFSCHSLRHLLGGNVDCYTCVKGGSERKSIWRGISKLNEHHMLWAWMSLIAVLYVPFHISMIAWGWIPDPRLI